MQSRSGACRRTRLRWLSTRQGWVRQRRKPRSRVRATCVAHDAAPGPDLQVPGATPREHPVAVAAPDLGQVFPPGLLPHRIATWVFGAHAQLCGNEAKDVQGNGLTHRQNQPRISKGAKLEREAQPVVSSTPYPDMLDVVVGRRVMAQQGGFIGGQVEQGRALACAPDASSRHVPSLRYPFIPAGLIPAGTALSVRGSSSGRRSPSPQPPPNRSQERLI